jgi:adenylate cyclase
MAEIIIEQPGVDSITVPLTTPELSLGRAEDNNVVLVADEVSRYHAKFMSNGPQCTLLDLSSLNGTYVNRQRVVQRLLTHLDEVWLGGKCRITFRDESASTVEMPPPSGPVSTISDDLAKITMEMEEVGNQLTMISKKENTTGVHEILPPTADQTVPPDPSLNPTELRRMGLAFRRLQALYKATQVIASDFDLTGRLKTVIDTTVEVLEADRGFIMLRDEETGELHASVARAMGQDVIAGSPSMTIANEAATTGDPVLVNDAMDDSEYGVRQSIIRQKICTAMCVPLKIEERILGSIYVDISRTGFRFEQEDLELFASMAAQSAMAIENVRLCEQMVESEKTRANLGRFLSPDIVELIMQEDTSLELGGRKRTVATMFCDIRGFTGISERLSPTDLVAMLNEHFTAMTEIIFRNNGTLDKFIGDELMAVFGSPFSNDDDTSRAVRSAIEMQVANRDLNKQREESGRPLFEMGIGIATGEVVAAYVGAPDRMEFTVIGDRVNTARRFCSVAEANQIVTGSITYEAVKEEVKTRDMGPVALKGKEAPLQAYEILLP